MSALDPRHMGRQAHEDRGALLAELAELADAEKRVTDTEREAQPPWQYWALAALGRRRDSMDAGDVAAVQKFIDATRPLVQPVASRGGEVSE